MSEKKGKKVQWVDDGRVIANMDLEGMPGTFYRPQKRQRFDEFGKTAEKPEPVQLTKAERRAITRGVTMAFLSVLGIVVAALTVLMLFATRVWLK